MKTSVFNWITRILEKRNQLFAVMLAISIGAAFSQGTWALVLGLGVMSLSIALTCFMLGAFYAEERVRRAELEARSFRTSKVQPVDIAVPVHKLMKDPSIQFQTATEYWRTHVEACSGNRRYECLVSYDQAVKEGTAPQHAAILALSTDPASSLQEDIRDLEKKP